MYSGVGTPKVTPTNIADRWINHGPFTHRPHAHMQCEDCHADDKFTIKNARRSSLTAEILMPRQTICAECHRPSSEQNLAQQKAVKPSTVLWLPSQRRLIGGFQPFQYLRNGGTMFAT